VAMVLAVGVLASCGASDQHTQPRAQQSTEQANHNADDIAFAHNMVAHHGQVVQMAEMVQTNSENRQMIDLASRMTTTQLGEIQAFNAWLVQWQEGASSDPAGHDGTTMPGMLDAATIDRLQSLRGADFDRLWLTSMIDHHKGAIVMAQGELEHGKNSDAMYLARTIIAEQQAEIDQMNQMLGG